MAVVYADTYSSLSYVDRPCGTDISNLWLDVVLVVDNSRGMTTPGFQNVATNIIDIFSANTRIGSKSSEPRTTRVGLITYASNATLKADLNKFQSIGDLMDGVFDSLSNVANSADSFIETGLAMAEQLLGSQGFGTGRDQYQKVIIVYASTYQTNGESDPESIADRLKMSGVKIITVAYGDAYGLMKSLSNIASPGFAFSNSPGNAGNLVAQIQTSLLQSNCFCPDGWIQYRADYSDPASSRYGVCIQLVSLQANWLSAKMSCNNRNSSLATEFSQDKHDFIFNAVQNTTGFSPPYHYHIGLNYVSSGSWVWTQPTGRQQVPLQQPFIWSSGYPIQASSKSAVMNMQSGQGTGWQNIATMTLSANFICETYSCDTDHYCDENMNKQQ
ncbi:hypothetical protein GCK72_003278 [Caenorhabditis remanei]|uniref:VWFA domain-containing protein n=1 Tax=Caenorhabditis remanei TaxID=31234 RepID=A0A6A5HYQ2_CAERE|nr:hypothetical protein GCK72_003278 [Caenorhabditis remanei]KAF1771452.1 hypothetical protein GCK72_003278 [Caenorhabditis remanei]